MCYLVYCIFKLEQNINIDEGSDSDSSIDIDDSKYIIEPNPKLNLVSKVSINTMRKIHYHPERK